VEENFFIFIASIMAGRHPWLKTVAGVSTSGDKDLNPYTQSISQCAGGPRGRAIACLVVNRGRQGETPPSGLTLSV
jgi:hypothetical protein